MRVPRTVRNIGISIGVMVLIFLIAGVVYVYLSGKQAPPAPKVTVKTEKTPDILKPAKPAANAQAGVALENYNTTVKAGDNSSLQIRTVPTAVCKIAVTNSDGTAVRDSGLAAKTADPYGFITWTWTVDPAAPAGNEPASVSCLYNGKGGVAVANIQVTR